MIWRHCLPASIIPAAQRAHRRLPVAPCLTLRAGLPQIEVIDSMLLVDHSVQTRAGGAPTRGTVRVSLRLSRGLATATEGTVELSGQTPAAPSRPPVPDARVSRSPVISRRLRSRSRCTGKASSLSPRSSRIQICCPPWILRPKPSGPRSRTDRGSATVVGPQWARRCCVSPRPATDHSVKHSPPSPTTAATKASERQTSTTRHEGKDHMLYTSWR